MNATEVLRIVDAIHRDKNIDKEIVFEGIEAALVSAAKKHYGEESNIEVSIDRQLGTIQATKDGELLDSEETVGRKCLCKGLVANIGLGQRRADGYEEPPLLTAGNDLACLMPFISADRLNYRARDVVESLIPQA